MEVKKNESVRLENKRKQFALVGFGVALALVLSAFEFTTYEEKERVVHTGLDLMVLEPEVVAASIPKKPKPKVKLAPIVDVYTKVKDDEPINTDPVELTDTPDLTPMPSGDVFGDEDGDEGYVETKIFEVVEERPTFPGGDAALAQYLGRSINYPAMARDMGVQGQVYISFVVDEMGRISDIKLLRGIGAGCDEEAINAVNGMPIWNPGKQRGVPVKVRYTLPVSFKMR